MTIHDQIWSRNIRPFVNNDTYYTQKDMQGLFSDRVAAKSQRPDHSKKQQFAVLDLLKLSSLMPGKAQ